MELLKYNIGDSFNLRNIDRVCMGKRCWMVRLDLKLGSSTLYIFLLCIHQVPTIKFKGE